MVVSFTVKCLDTFHYFLGTEGFVCFCRKTLVEYGLTHIFGLLGKRYVLRVEPRDLGPTRHDHENCM